MASEPQWLSICRRIYSRFAWFGVNGSYLLLCGEKELSASSRPTIRQAAKSFWESLPTLLTPLIILGGIFGGIFTPTEAGAVAVAYSLVLGIFLYKSVGWKEIKAVFVESAYSTASVMLVVMGCTLFGWILAIEQVPTAIGNYIVSLVGHNVPLFLLAVNIFLLFLGCFMEPAAAIMIIMPIFLPICQKLNIDLVHFGLVVLLNLMIGLLTPPVDWFKYNGGYGKETD